jgi:NDP-sugar pyrophosphorylase family protein
VKKCAVIIAGGLGRRLHPYTTILPKPLLPVGGVSIIEILINQLSRNGFENITISLGFGGDLIRAIVKDGSKYNVDITYFQEEYPLGTAGALKFMKNIPDSALILNGDILTSLNFSEFYDNFVENNLSASFAVRTEITSINYGVVELDNDDLLIDFSEKPNYEHLVAMGIYAIKKSTLDFMDSKIKEFDMPDLLKEIQKHNKPVKGYRSSAYWMDLGQVTDLKLAEKDFIEDPEKFSWVEPLLWQT